MTSRFLVLAALFACKHTTLAPPSAILLAADDAEPPTFDVEISCAQVAETPEQTIRVERAVGASVSVRLCTEVGSGNEWAEAAVDKRVIRTLWQFIPPPETQIIGGDGWREAIYQVSDAGESVIELVYRRQWEEGEATATVTLQISAEP